MKLLTIIFTIGAAGVGGSLGFPLASPNVSGAGAQSCAAFVQRAGPNGVPDDASLQWALGYLTGRAAASNAPHRAFSGPEGIAHNLMAYCRAHPYSQLDNAAASFFERRRYCRAAHGCG